MSGELAAGHLATMGILVAACLIELGPGFRDRRVGLVALLAVAAVAIATVGTNGAAGAPGIVCFVAGTWFGARYAGARGFGLHVAAAGAAVTVMALEFWGGVVGPTWLGFLHAPDVAVGPFLVGAGASVLGSARGQGASALYVATGAALALGVVALGALIGSGGAEVALAAGGMVVHEVVVSFGSGESTELASAALVMPLKSLSVLALCPALAVLIAALLGAGRRGVMIAAVCGGGALFFGAVGLGLTSSVDPSWIAASIAEIETKLTFGSSGEPTTWIYPPLETAPSVALASMVPWVAAGAFLLIVAVGGGARYAAPTTLRDDRRLGGYGLVLAGVTLVALGASTRGAAWSEWAATLLAIPSALVAVAAVDWFFADRRLVLYRALSLPAVAGGIVAIWFLTWGTS